MLLSRHGSQRYVFIILTCRVCIITSTTKRIVDAQERDLRLKKKSGLQKMLTASRFGPRTGIEPALFRQVFYHSIPKWLVEESFCFELKYINFKKILKTINNSNGVLFIRLLYKPFELILLIFQKSDSMPDKYPEKRPVYRCKELRWPDWAY